MRFVAVAAVSPWPSCSVALLKRLVSSKRPLVLARAPLFSILRRDRFKSSGRPVASISSCAISAAGFGPRSAAGRMENRGSTTTVVAPSRLCATKTATSPSKIEA